VSNERVTEADPVHDQTKGRRRGAGYLAETEKRVWHAGKRGHHAADEIVLLELEDAEAG
jgi:hypothetical protein